jgi:hypothetical protein
MSRPCQGDDAKKKAALEAMLRRLCTPKKSSGKLDVSEEIYNEWKKGGAARKELLNILGSVKGDKDSRAP